jgi:ankyrin repeat protein
MLLEHGAKEAINQENNNKSTPLFMAVQNGHIDICSLLFEHGAQEVVNQESD